VPPVSLDEAKRHLRVVVPDENGILPEHEDDPLIATLISAAASALDAPDGWLGRSLVEQTLELVLDRFPGNEVLLPFGPVQEVVTVKYDDGDGEEQTVLADDYEVDTTKEEGGWLLPVESWPSTFDAVNAVRVRYVTGYPLASGDVPTTPAPIKVAILEGVRALYDGLSGPELEASERVQKAMLATYRVFR